MKDIVKEYKEVLDMLYNNRVLLQERMNESINYLNGLLKRASKDVKRHAKIAADMNRTDDERWNSLNYVDRYHGSENRYNFFALVALRIHLHDQGQYLSNEFAIQKIEKEYKRLLAQQNHDYKEDSYRKFDKEQPTAGQVIAVPQIQSNSDDLLFYKQHSNESNNIYNSTNLYKSKVFTNTRNNNLENNIYSAKKSKVRLI